VLVELVGYYTSTYLEAKLKALAAIRHRPVVVVIDESLGDAGAVPASAVVRFRRRVDARALVDAVERSATSRRDGVLA
jgi:predicted nuclease of restriction endonuclease-like RecB superfamily